MSEAVLGKAASVRQIFEAPGWYLKGTGFNIRIRQETVHHLVAGMACEDILDVGCGNGAISMPLLQSNNRLTLVDVSTAMISRASANIPVGLADNVELVNEDLMAAPLKPHGYDLILCLGVLAHVDSPAATITRVASLLRPGGTLILEFTDAFHLIGLLNTLYHRLRSFLKPSGYSLNRLSHRDVFTMLRGSNLAVVSSYRYGMFLPLLHKLFSQDTLYNVVRAIFGTSETSRNGFLGNAYICVVKNAR